MKCGFVVALLIGAAVGWLFFGRDLRQMPRVAAGSACRPHGDDGQVAKPAAIVPAAGDQWVRDWARGVGQRSWAAVQHHECSSEDR